MYDTLCSCEHARVLIVKSTKNISTNCTVYTYGICGSNAISLGMEYTSVHSRPDSSFVYSTVLLFFLFFLEDFGGNQPFIQQEPFTNCTSPFYRMNNVKSILRCRDYVGEAP